jgi:hypothetical protein
VNYPCVSPGSSKMKGRHVRPISVGSDRACGCCAVFKGRREVRTRGFLAERGLSKLNSMHGLKLHDMWRNARHHGNSHVGAPAGPARFGRRTRPYGRRTSHRFPPRAPEGAGRRPAMSPCRRGPFKGLPRKEVIQPQLPLRLPCYDFTPVTSPTFDGSLPCGLGHRLRVLLTPVV